MLHTTTKDGDMSGDNYVAFMNWKSVWPVEFVTFYSLEQVADSISFRFDNSLMQIQRKTKLLTFIYWHETLLFFYYVTNSY